MKKIIVNFLIFILFFLFLFSFEIYAQGIFIGIDFFAELNMGWQNYTYLNFTAENPWNFIFILHTGLRFSFFPITRINNRQYNNLPLGLIILVLELNGMVVLVWVSQKIYLS
ncbi:MAG: hypothetical protein WH035_05545 [Spirochaetota bacterium]